MKKRLTSRLGIRVFFTCVVMLELLVLVAASNAVTDLLHRWLGFTRSIPDVVWMLIVSLLLGAGSTTLLGICFFEPVEAIREAMHKVAQGDFTVRLDDSRGFREIQQIRSDFNLMTQELSATEILQTDFVSNVSHEFKTPINAIEGYATLLQDGDGLTADEQAEYVERILLNTRRLSKLVGGILLLSKLDNQGISYAKTAFSLDEQIRQTVVYLEPVWAERDTQLDAELERVDFVGAEALMQRVWDNLVENAIKFGPQGGVVRLRLYKDGSQAVFTSENACDPIPSEALNHLFDRFYQTDSSHKDEGNGLGLALVKKILSTCGGEISVENIPGGCRFTVKLPV